MREILLKILSKAKSWSDIYQELAKLNSETPKLAGTLFEHFCKYYYLAESKVASDYKNVWLYEEAPQKIKEKLNIAKQDHGVDLILVDHEDKFTVVQCKFRNDQSSRLSWTKDKIANLFAEADRADFIIVFSNASDLDEYSKNKQAKKFNLVTLGELITTSTETIQQIIKLIERKEIKAKPTRKPREHQTLAIREVLKGFRSHDRGQLVLPCGAGKTLTALWIKEQLKPQHTLVLVPSLALLRQIKDEWHSTEENWVPYLCVCSERDIDNITDAPIVHTYEIGGRVTTEIQEICNFLKQHKETIIYSTYQSLDAISNAIRRLDFQFDLAICDEAHKTAGSKISTFGLIHRDEEVPVKKRLYMTATPRIVSEQAKSKLGEDQIKYLADMSDPIIFGPEFYRMSFAEAIDKKILVDYQIIAIGVSDIKLQQQILERQFAGDDETTIEDIANNYALEKVMTKHSATHAITFHSSIKRAEQFKERHEKIYPNILTDHVSGLQTTNDRNIVMDRFRNSPKAIITNARCLTEGVDVPTIDIVYFCDPKNSKIDIVQASGRALRRAVHKDKKFGYIVVPIFHQEEERVEKTIESSAFKNLITIVRALCDQDERLVDEINRIKIGKGTRKPTSQSAHIKIEDELPLIVLENFEEKLKNAIFDQVVEKTADNWMVMYELLKEFRQKNPDNWPNQRNLKEKKIGIWCNARRQDYKKRNSWLPPEREKLLDEINFPWDPNEEDWIINIQNLRKFRQGNPNSWPSDRAKNIEEKKLGHWCGHVRQSFKKGTLTAERKKVLDKLQFSWDPKEDEWQRGINLLIAFKKRNPKRWPSQIGKNLQEKKLGIWCGTRRQEFKRRKLSAERKIFLDSLGFPWDPLEEEWQRYIQLLQGFRKINPNKWPNSESKNLNEKDLGRWCQYLRNRYRGNKLNQDRIFVLNKMGFIWEPGDLLWNTMYEKLKKFKQNNPNKWPSHGSLNEEEKQLATWCTDRRKNYKANQLSQNKIEKLEQLGFLWNPKEDQREDVLKKLQDFRKQYPERWPSDRSTNIIERKLGKWCSHKRTAYKNGSLNKKVIEQLNSLKFSWNIVDFWWDEMIIQLKEFRKKNPNRWPSVHSKNFEEKQLGIQCSYRRKEYKDGRMSQDKIEQLNGLSFSWDPSEEKWDQGISDLISFRKKNPDRWPSTIAKELQEKKLGSWCSNRRKDYKVGRLTQERIKILNDLGFPWSLKG